ncbi:hypothetical protein RJ641_000267 [Dillenia turbinata]|uniref:Uncharacterized protein n=1 Tax=Dillenia turbinata TaxID=194707 RepID=A0AAN8W5Z9_9MAGN
MSTHHDGCRRSLTLPILAIPALGFGIWMSTHHDESNLGRSLDEVELQSNLIQKTRILLNNTENLKCMKSCPMKADDLNNLPKKIPHKPKGRTLFCGYPGVNASYYDLSSHPVCSNSYGKLYKNSPASIATIVLLAGPELQNI